MKKILPYVFISFAFAVMLLIAHKESFNYRFDQDLIRNYLRSQDIEDLRGEIKDRVIISDSDIYIASGFLYAVGENPAKYNFQHPPAMKYLFGFSTLLTGNPLWVQMFLGLVLLLLTYFLSEKIFKNKFLSLIPAGLLLFDPVFGEMMNGAYLDLGQTVFALVFIISALYYPKKWLLTGIALGLFAASKFWSTTIIYIIVVFGWRLLVRKEKIGMTKAFLSLFIAVLTYVLIYAKFFINGGGIIGFVELQGRMLKFMLSHNSASGFGSAALLFITGFFSPWWKSGVERAGDWCILWPPGLISSIILAIKSKLKSLESLIYLLPTIYLLLIGTGVPFTRYFLIILPFTYISLVKLAAGFWKPKK